MRQSLKILNKNKHKENHPFENSILNYNEGSLTREEYTQLNWNDKTCASSHITSEYGIHQNDNQNRGTFIQHPSIKNKKKSQGYDLLNPCYSDSQAMKMNALPINKNNSAIVICSNDNQDQLIKSRMDWADTGNSNFITEKVMVWQFNNFRVR